MSPFMKSLGLFGVFLFALAMLKACPTQQSQEPTAKNEPIVQSEPSPRPEPSTPEPRPEPILPEPVPEVRRESKPETSPEKQAIALHPLMKEVDKARYEKDLALIAKPRLPGSAHWKVVQDLCAQRFKESGYKVELHTYQTGVNVIGVKEGKTKPKERVMLSAHYDSVSNCDGADDNASGTAGVLEAARVLAKQEHDRTIVVACWDEEERGLIGAKAYATRAQSNKEDIKMNFVFEMIGYYSDTPQSQTLPQGLDLLFPTQAKKITDNQSKGDFVALIGDTGSVPSATLMEQYGQAVGLSVIGLAVADGLKKTNLVQDLRRSDHAPFWDIDVPAMMITDTSEFRYQPYHCRNNAKDSIEKLNGDFAQKIIQVTVGAAAALLSPKP